MSTPELPQRVMAALEFEPRVNLHRFPMRARPGPGTLVLEGQAESVMAKRIALRIAGDLASEEQLFLVDALDVGPPDSRPDGEILDAFGRMLLDLPELRGFTIRRRRPEQPETLRVATTDGLAGEVDIGVRQGVIELAGAVPSLSHRRMVEAVAWWVGGCRGVINGLQIEPAERDGDDELAEAVQLVLEIDPWIPNSQLFGVDVEFGVVTLRGTVQQEVHRHRAEHDAWCVEGVREVRNAIEVFP